MWKLIVGSLIIGNSAIASIEVQMNLKALYADKIEKMTEEQKNYINDNMDTIKEKTNDTLKAKTKALQKAKYLNDSNVIEFLLNPNGTIENFKYLNKSNENQFNQLSKKVCEDTIKKIPLPKETTPIRLIFEYKIQKNSIEKIKNIQPIDTNIIERGTTRFEHSMNQQVKKFETSKDGFINTTTNPKSCAEITILTEMNQKITGGWSTIFQRSDYNIEIPKGKYKLLVDTKQTCNINIQYP